MIQRIQTLYLLFAAILMSLTLFFPLATITYGGNEIVLKAFTIVSTGSEIRSQLPLYLGCMLAVPTLMSIITIFLYKKRMLQLRLCVSQIVLQVGALAFIGVYCYRVYDVVSEVSKGIFSLELVSILPIIAIIFTILAIRGIAKDEALVRSLDRIR